MKKTLLILSLFFFTQIFAQLEIGQTAPDFKLWLINGEKITNTTTLNKVVVFKFWFTTCVPCISGIPKLNKLVKKYKDNKDIIFIAPALDNKNVINKFLRYYPFYFKIAYNSIDVANVYNSNGIYPTYVIINKTGKIAFIDSQNQKSKESDLEKEIKKLMRK